MCLELNKISIIKKKINILTKNKKLPIQLKQNKNINTVINRTGTLQLYNLYASMKHGLVCFMKYEKKYVIE